MAREQGAFTLTDLTCDYKREPIDIQGAPLLRWKLVGAEKQQAFRVRAAGSAQLLSSPDFWDSGWIKSPKPFIQYAGLPIPSLECVFWRVDVRDDLGREAFAMSTWKQAIEEDDWKAKWIGFDEGRELYDPSVPYYCADDFEKGENHPFLPPPVYLRYCFELNRLSISSATLRVSAFGFADVSINGRRAVTGYLIPGVCDYRRRVYYRSFDVKKLLREGENALGCVLADGLYAGYVGLNPREWWGKRPRVSLQLDIEYTDSSRQRVVSSENWKASFGPWLYADIMHGAGYDARREISGWDIPGFDDGDWKKVDAGAEYDHIPQAHPGVPIIEQGRWEAKIVPDGESCKVDCLKCFSGVLRVRVCGENGARLDIYHAEELDKGELYLRANRSAEAHDCYILKGKGEEAFQPEFTYHGFRYARIDVTGDAQILSVEAVAISSELPEPARLHSENEVVNAVWKLVENTRQSNMMDHPTDVNARDERLGWGADGHFFMHTASRSCFNALFLRKWMRDIIDGQLDDGAFWATAPAVMMKDILPFAGDLQSDMGVHVAWLMLMLYEDEAAVREYFPALERYFDFQLLNSDRLMRFATGRDWLDIASQDHRSDFDHGYGNCPAGLLGTIYFARNAQMMVGISKALGYDERAEYYNKRYLEIRKAFHTFFSRRDGLLRDATQGAYLLAAATGLLDAHEITAAREWVKRDFDANGASWGTSSTPMALYGMVKLGLAREACDFITSRDFPSYGYMASCGATAVWERWDAIIDSAFHPHEMNAFDHIGLAGVGDWMIGGLAGVKELAPGFSRILFAPVVSEIVGYMEISFESVRGAISCKWRFENGALDFMCLVPSCSAGDIELPCLSGANVEIIEGESIVTSRQNADDKLLLTVKPGRIHISIR